MTIAEICSGISPYPGFRGSLQNRDVAVNPLHWIAGSKGQRSNQHLVERHPPENKDRFSNRLNDSSGRFAPVPCYVQRPGNKQRGIREDWAIARERKVNPNPVNSGLAGGAVHTRRLAGLTSRWTRPARVQVGQEAWTISDGQAKELRATVRRST